MAAHRARKAKEYRMMRIAADLKNKDDRCQAIKKGFYALNHMRNSMKDIMEKTNTELKVWLFLSFITSIFLPFLFLNIIYSLN